jgi:hypothetical protein
MSRVRFPVNAITIETFKRDAEGWPNPNQTQRAETNNQCLLDQHDTIHSSKVLFLARWKKNTTDNRLLDKDGLLT